MRIFLLFLALTFTAQAQFIAPATKLAGKPITFDTLSCADTNVTCWYSFKNRPNSRNGMNVEILVLSNSPTDTVIVEERRMLTAIVQDSVFIKQVLFQPFKSSSTDTLATFTPIIGSKWYFAKFIVYTNYLFEIRLKRMSPATYKPSIVWKYWIQDEEKP